MLISLKPRSWQPKFRAVGIDWSHPLSWGLGFCALAPDAQELVHNAPSTHFTGTFGVTTNKGVAWQDAADTGVSTAIEWPAVTTSAWLNAGDFTVSVLADIRVADFAASGNYAMLSKVASSGANVAAAIVDTSGVFKFGVFSDTAAPVNGTVDITSELVAGARLWTWVYSGTTATCYIDGRQLDTFIVTPHGAFTDSTIRINMGALAQGSRGRHIMWTVHNRALRQAEILLLAREPYAFLKPIQPFLQPQAILSSSVPGPALVQVVSNLRW